MDWISVKDRLPKEERFIPQRYLVSDGKLVLESTFFRGKFHSVVDPCNELRETTHWMPLPEPPKRESSFERWWRENDAWLINKQAAKVVWDAAIKASKQPDFVE